ncbi:MAG TPA: redoxin domain-containing protein [Candidatus Hydrogenedentes bacterium]|nr:redoxin domain-containing protein [Candidatus Hydrogenedentota bacterium]HOL75472.1 redoxin domain-containing protein [Candidatus Hydrogenedentota bacterium]HPO86086.1 redoxin domain-containing protein [Candidatus Hydrogenedentota bacterium]
MKKFLKKWLAIILLGICCGLPLFANAQLQRGAKAPTFKAHDIQGREVDLEKLLGNDLVILFFFSRNSGQDLAAKLKEIHRTRQEKLPIVAVGLKEDEDALRQFANELQISYYILKDSPEVSADSRYGPFRVLPMTFFVISDGTVLNVIEGGGGGQAAVIAKVAEAVLQRARAAADKDSRVAYAQEAHSVAQQAVQLGLDEKNAYTLSGYAQAEMGNFEAAREDFERANDVEGLAFLALKQGEYEKAIELAEKAGADAGYAQTIKAEAYIRLGKQDEALQILQAAVTKPASEWQVSEAYTHLGRLKQLRGEVDGALAAYDNAQVLNALNVSALTNQSETLRQQGQLEKAAQVLQTAKARRVDDSLAKVMLEQISRDLEATRDLKKREALQKQVQELVERFKKQKESADAATTDTWTSRGIILAFLPGKTTPGAYVERAGIEVALARAIEDKLAEEPRIKIVDREMIESVLDELNLGSSELTDPATRLRLGKLFAANVLAFLDFAPAGKDVAAFVRLVDTETTTLKAQVSEKVASDADILALADEMAAELVRRLDEGYLLQGLVADVNAQGILINLGSNQGVEVGKVFAVLQDENPIKVGGKVLPRTPIPIALVEVISVEDELSTCRVVPNSMRGDVKLVKEMKVKEMPRSQKSAK